MSTKKETKIVEIGFEDLKQVAGGAPKKKEIRFPPIYIVCSPNGGGCTISETPPKQ